VVAVKHLLLDASLLEAEFSSAVKLAEVQH
jgi:hypothetical protein